MKKLLIIPVIGLTLFCVSCKKADSVKSKILGTWNADYVAADENENGVMDENEKSRDDAFLNTSTFKSDGTIMNIYQENATAPVDTSYGLTYEISSDEKSIQFTDDEGSYNYSIDELTNSRFTLSTLIDGDKIWVSFVK